MVVAGLLCIWLEFYHNPPTFFSPGVPFRNPEKKPPTIYPTLSRLLAVKFTDMSGTASVVCRGGHRPRPFR